MREQQIQKRIIDYLEECGAYVVKVIKANRAGTPDLIACLNGQFIGIEVKTQDGKVSELQDYHLRLIRESSGTALVVRSLDDVKNKLKLF